MTYTCWCPDRWQTEQDGKEFPSSACVHARDAAERYSELHCGFWSDPFSYLEVHVRAPDGTLSRWKVEVEAVPEFTATRLKDAP